MEILLWLLGAVVALGLVAYAVHAYRMKTDHCYRYRVDQAVQDDDARRKLAKLRKHPMKEVRDLAGKL